MNINEIKDIIITVGYPIFTSLLCMWYVREQNKDAREERDKMNKELCEKIEMLNESITKLTAIHLTNIENKRGVYIEHDYGD